jgi:hypothetical protein
VRSTPGGKPPTVTSPSGESLLAPAILGLVAIVAIWWLVEKARPRLQVSDLSLLSPQEPYFEE